MKHSTKRKKIERLTSIYNNGEKSTEVEPMATTRISYLPTKLHHNEQGITNTEETAQMCVIRESREEPSIEKISIQEDVRTSNDNLGRNVLNKKPIKPRYPRRDKKVPVRFTICL